MNDPSQHLVWQPPKDAVRGRHLLEQVLAEASPKTFGPFLRGQYDGAFEKLDLLSHFLVQIKDLLIKTA